MKKRSKLYIKANTEERSFTYSGISFSEFIQYLDNPLDNLLLAKGDYMGNAQAHHFELLEGATEIRALAEGGIDPFGDLCFLDYQQPGAAARLDRQQVAEILFLAHIGEPIESPFFAPLDNRFAYLSHDDGWYGKLYCRSMGEFMSVLWKKLTGKANAPMSAKMQNELLSIAQKGLAIDMEEPHCPLPGIYIVGEYTDMDELMNHWQEIKATATPIHLERDIGKRYRCVPELRGA